jgi:hypothetical protein
MKSFKSDCLECLRRSIDQSAPTDRIWTCNGNLSHRKNTLWRSIQSSLSCSSATRSNSRSRETTTIRISTHAKLQQCQHIVNIKPGKILRFAKSGTHLFPKQSLGPILNGRKTSLSSPRNSAGASSSQRSGRNSAGRWKFRAERWAAHRFMVRLVWGGTIWPAMLAGSVVVVRKSMSGAGG